MDFLQISAKEPKSVHQQQVLSEMDSYDIQLCLDHETVKTNQFSLSWNCAKGDVSVSRRHIISFLNQMCVFRIDIPQHFVKYIQQFCDNSSNTMLAKIVPNNLPSISTTSVDGMGVPVFGSSGKIRGRVRRISSLLSSDRMLEIE
jgi:hypothetical protein